MKAPALPGMKLPSIDFQALAEDFKTLDPKDPGLWPLLPRIIILLAVFLLLLLASWWFGWNTQFEELDQMRQEEAQLKEDWLQKKRLAVNRDAYREQLAEIDKSFGTLLRQLPDKTEMESMLVDINQSGVGRGLLFEQFKPANESMKDFYAELPITIKLIGRYHDLGAFTGDIARLSRIVTLNDIDLTADKGDQLTMTMVAKTFRYLDEEEIAQQRKAAQEAAKKKKGKS